MKNPLHNVALVALITTSEDKSSRYQVVEIRMFFLEVELWH